MSMLFYREAMAKTRFFLLGVIPALFLQGLGAYLYFVVLADTAVASPMYAAVKVIMLVWPLLWFALGAPIPRFHLTFNRQTITTGIVAGVGISFVIAAYAALSYGNLLPYANLLTTKADDLFPLAYYVPVAIIFSLLHSLFEEYYWRWFAFGGLRHRMSDTAAMVASSAAFTFHHVLILSQFFPVTLTALASIGVFVGGCIWCVMYRKANALTGAWISHAMIDATLFAIGYTLIF